jgi:hypothetical protein
MNVIDVFNSLQTQEQAVECLESSAGAVSRCALVEDGADGTRIPLRNWVPVHRPHAQREEVG